MGPEPSRCFALDQCHSVIHQAWDGNQWQAERDYLGGNFTGEPAAVAWSSDRLDVFAIGRDHQMYHKAWDGNQWQSDWDSLGGYATSIPVQSHEVLTRLMFSGADSTAPSGIKRGTGRIEMQIGLRWDSLSYLQPTTLRTRRDPLLLIHRVRLTLLIVPRPGGTVQAVESQQ